MKKPIPFRRFQGIQFGWAALPPVILIAALVWLLLLPRIHGKVRREHEILARAISGRVSTFMSGGERQLLALAELVEKAWYFDRIEGSAMLDAHCGDGEIFETIYRLDGQTRTALHVGLARSRRDLRNDLLSMDMSGRGFLSESLGSRSPSWSETFMSTASGHLAVALTVPLPDGAIVGEIKLDRLSKFSSQLAPGARLLALILDRRGRIVADSRNLGEGRHLNLAGLFPGSPPNPGSLATSEFELDGRRFLGTLVPVEALGWKVLVAQPLEQAREMPRTVFAILAVGLGMALSLAAGMSWFLAGNLSRIFGAYCDRVQAVARGEYDLQWPASRTVEFAALVENLERMVEMIRRREHQLAASENRLRITLDSIGDGVIAADAGGNVARMNPMAEALTGWSAEEARARPLSEVFRIVNAHTRETVENPVEKVLASGEIVGLANHTVLVSRDGREYQIADSGAPIREDDGTIVGVVLVFRDVTESYAKEQLIRENEQRLQDITANIPGVVYQFRSSGHHDYTNTFVSRKTREIFGLEPNPETFFEEFFECVPQADKDRFAESVRDAVDRVVPWKYEGRFNRPDGKTIWFSGNSSPRRETDRVDFYGVLADITERKHLEESLRLTQFFFEKASVGIYRIGQDGRILDANERGCQSLGYAKPELLQKMVWDINPSIDAAQWLNHARKLRGRTAMSIETVHQTKDGKVFPVEILINPVTYEDREYRIAFVQDISERKRAEKEAERLEAALLQSQKMEAIGTLAGGIAHDFNNILSGVIGYSELSLPHVPEGSKLDRNLRRILAAGFRARDLVAQILTFSRREERDLRPLQIGPLVKEALKLIRSSLPSTIQIDQRIDPQLPPVQADPTQVHQVVMNLCTNAAQAMAPEGGRLTAAVSSLHLSERDIQLHPELTPGDFVKLMIADTGAGIDPEILEKIYDPYFTTKEKGKGTGLGLSVVLGIVQSYGGAIYAYSEPGSGTTFHIYIPAAENLAGEESAPKAPPVGGDERILLVDDEPMLLDVGRQLLENLGYQVTTVQGGPAALALFQENPPAFDLVVTDMTMPGLTGDKLARKIWETRPDIPVILCTGYSANLSPKKAARMGLHALVFKPFTEAEIARAIREALDGRI